MIGSMLIIYKNNRNTIIKKVKKKGNSMKFMSVISVVFITSLLLSTSMADAKKPPKGKSITCYVIRKAGDGKLYCAPLSVPSSSQQPAGSCPVVLGGSYVYNKAVCLKELTTFAW